MYLEYIFFIYFLVKNTDILNTINSFITFCHCIELNTIYIYYLALVLSECSWNILSDIP